MTCEAKMRPFPNDTELQCDLDDEAHDFHKSTLRDYAYPGSATTIEWADTDRRTFRGEWASCAVSVHCVLPNRHRGRCAV